MHVEPGRQASYKVLGADIVAAGVLVAHAPALLKRPRLWLRTALAVIFFSLSMQAFHMPVGPSELQFVGAMPTVLEPLFTVLIFKGTRKARGSGWARTCLDGRLTARA